jgi:ATPase subunit of ABC transporter with duplicated ATPase domains
VELDWQIGQLSGGESVLLCLAAQLLRAPAVLLLDEPTNNLDLAARRRLHEAVRSWHGTMIVVTHDRELLETVDQIADLRDGELRWYGGTFSDYRAAVEAEQETADRLARAAEQDFSGRNVSWLRPASSSTAGCATARRCGTPNANPRSSWANVNARPRSPPASTATCTSTSWPRPESG